MSEQSQSLECQMQTLSRGLTTDTARLLDLVGEFDRVHGWATHGLRSSADWLGKECGFSPTSARERARVARALDQLPLLHRAFGDGELSYSKIRIVTRSATPDTESELLALALSMTAGELERKLARRKPGGDDGDCPDGTVSWRIRRDGKVKLEAVLTQEQFQTLRAALSSAHEELVATASDMAAAEPVPAEPALDDEPAGQREPAEMHREEARTEASPAAATADDPHAEQTDPGTEQADPGTDQDESDAERAKPSAERARRSDAGRSAAGPVAWSAGERSGRVGIEVLVAMARSQLRAGSDRRTGAAQEGGVPEQVAAGGTPADVAA